MTKEELADVLAEHKAWLKGNSGKRANLAHANLVDANLVGANLAHARLIGASLNGARLDGARFDRASLVGASLVGARLVGARLYGASLYGASLYGAKLNGKTVIGVLRRATRSDGYEFFLWHCQEGFFVKAGCRFLDMGAAREHWTTTRQGTPIGNESLDILDFFSAAIKRQEVSQ